MNQHITLNCDKINMLKRFRLCRALTEKLCENLSDADASVQSMEDASPAKWHLAHTSWFFETFILRDHVDGYQLYDDIFPFLFNSYYEAEGDRHIRNKRGLITRPSLDEILQYRRHVTDIIVNHADRFSVKVIALLELGIHHEQQHQELLLTDILHLFSCNPIQPALWPNNNILSNTLNPIAWVKGNAGVQTIGHEGKGFAFDCEGPRHDILLEPYEIADRTVSNGEWIEFVESGGYDDAQYWLSDGWAWVQKDQINAPSYWVKKDNIWFQFGLGGLQPLDINAPVTHISFYEADAYTSWAAQNIDGLENVRLPTEGEWEAIAQNHNDSVGNQLDRAGAIKAYGKLGDTNFYGDVWEWTGSAFRPYPNFKAAKGAIGEYNGKFMSGQFILKGGSCATPRGHIRSSYRNFFYPQHRWQFTGLRLARHIG